MKICRFAKYTSYQNTGLDWMHIIPTTWSIIRIKSLFKLRNIPSSNDHGLELLSVYTHIGVRPRRSLVQRGNRASNTDGYWIVKKGDIISNKLLAWMGAIGVSHFDGVTSPAYDILFPSQPCNTTYYHYLFRTQMYLNQFKRRSRGIMDMRLRLYFDQLGQIPIPIPPINEQNQIVAYLNLQSKKIDRLVRNKRRIIELLKEKKEAIINQAVTRGLDPNVKLKPSGVPWLGDIPNHWSVLPLKHLVKFNIKVLPDSTNKDYTFNYLDISSVSNGFLNKKPERLNFGDAPSRARRVISKDDTLLSMVRTYLKAVYFVKEDVKDWIASTGFAVLTPYKKIYPPFLSFLIQSNSFIERVIKESKGVAYPAINEPVLGSLKIAYPESLAEQQKISERLENSIKSIDKAMTMNEHSINLMQEYRQRLIADVVTGKIDVRNISVPVSDDVIEEEIEQYLNEEAVEDDAELMEEVYADD